MYITRLTISKQPEFESEKPSNMFEREILIADDAVDSLMFGVLSTQEFCCRSRSAQGENLTNGCLKKHWARRTLASRRLPGCRASHAHSGSIASDATGACKSTLFDSI